MRGSNHAGRVAMMAALAASVVIFTGPAAAGPPTEHLRAQLERALKTLEDPTLKEDGMLARRRQAVRQVANDIFDFEETARRSLGRHWPARTPAERTDFVSLFSDLLERSYFSKIESYGGERISYLSDTIDGEHALVRTRLVTRRGTEIPVDYKMGLKGGRWLIYDVVIEGVSLVANYRTQFNKIITTSSFGELIRRMKDRKEEMVQDSLRRS